MKLAISLLKVKDKTGQNYENIINEHEQKDNFFDDLDKNMNDEL